MSKLREQCGEPEISHHPKTKIDIKDGGKEWIYMKKCC